MKFSKTQMTAIAAVIVAAAPTVMNALTDANLHLPAWAYVALTVIVSLCRGLAPSTSGIAADAGKVGDPHVE